MTVLRGCIRASTEPCRLERQIITAGRNCWLEFDFGGRTRNDLRSSNVDYLVFPRLSALAEVAWSPKADRSPAYQDFIGRLAAQGGRWLASGVNFYPSPELPWRLDLDSVGVVAASDGGVSGKVATLAAPGYPATAITATINWGDGTSSTGSVNGAPATPTTVNGLYAVTGSHSYAPPGVYSAR